ncbi:MAG: cytochrome P460 family protein [Myxococcales bacterium]|nr:cytochrome P460 family protein [Myxococcales bacterium]
MARSSSSLLAAAAVLAGAAACGDPAAPEFPEDYARSFVEVRACRPSGDHDLRSVRVLVDPSGLSSYLTRDAPHPEGAVVLKEEYEFGDRACAGPVAEWTVMRRRATAEHGGWRWQRVDADRQVVSEDDSRCIGCHAACGQAPDGHDGTCAVP